MSGIHPTRRILGKLATPLCAAAGLAASTAAAPLDNYTWRNVFIGGGGFVPGILFHPKAKGVAYARTDMGGAYRWNSASGTWTPITDQFNATDWNRYGIESIAMDPQNPDLVYIASGTYAEHDWSGNGAILRSHDRGATWNVVNMSFKFGGNENGRSVGEKLVVDPNNGSILFVATRLNGLWKSTDSAKTWSQVTSFPVSITANNDGLGFVVFDPRTGTAGTATKTAYVGVEQISPNLYKSTDGGTTWSAVAGAPTDMMPHHGVLASDGSMYFTYGNGDGPNGITAGKVWKLNTATGSWSDISPVANATFGFAGLDVDAQNPQTIMVSSMDLWWPSDNQWRSTDGGKTWKDMNANSTRSAALTPFLRWGGTDASMGSGNWEGSLAIDPFDSDRVMYGTGATIMGTENVTNVDKGSKATWTPHIEGFEENAVLDLASPPSGPDLLSAMGDIGGFIHSDITVSPASGMLNPYYTTESSVDFAELSPSRIVRVGTGCTGTCGSVTTNGGTSWTSFASAPGGGTTSGVIAIAADGSTIVWSPASTAAYSTTNSGSTWTACAGLSGTGVQVVADRVNPKKFYAVVGGTLYASTDGAKTFAAKAAGLSGAYLRAVPGREGEIWLSGGNGLYKSTDGGASFAQVKTAGAIGYCGFGKAAPGQTHPAIFVNGTIDGTIAIYRSDDTGATWMRVNDNLHQWGGGTNVIGDPKVYARFYLATNGRGIIVGDKTGSTATTASSIPEPGLVRHGGQLLSTLGDISLFDPAGRCVRASNAVGRSAILDLAGLHPGLYFAKSRGSSLTVGVYR
jgi:hypothetical protein